MSIALTNLIGNGVATIVVAKWTKSLDTNFLRLWLRQGSTEPADEVL